MARSNRYQAVISHVFAERYDENQDVFPFTKSDLKSAGELMGVTLPENLEDIIYSFRHRNPLPEHIQGTATQGCEWIIELAGRGAYRFKKANINRIFPTQELSPLETLDLTPGLIYDLELPGTSRLDNIIRYNQLISDVLRVFADHVQSHLRTSIQGVGQIEVGCLYVSTDANVIIPVHLSPESGPINGLKAAQNIRFADEKYPQMTCRAVIAQLRDKITWFSLKLNQMETVSGSPVNRRLDFIQKLDDQVWRWVHLIECTCSN